MSTYILVERLFCYIVQVAQLVIIALKNMELVVVISSFVAKNDNWNIENKLH